MGVDELADRQVDFRNNGLKQARVLGNPFFLSVDHIMEVPLSREKITNGGPLLAFGVDHLLEFSFSKGRSREGVPS